MRKFTKSLMALAMLCIAGVTNAKERVAFSLDFSEVDSYDFQYGAPEGTSVSLEDGLLVITNDKKQTNFWDLQYDLAEDFGAAKGLSYRITIEYKTTVDGTCALGFGTLKGMDQYADRVNWYGIEIKASDDFQTLTWNIASYPNTNVENHVIMQSGDLVGTIYIKKIEVVEIYSDIAIASEGQDGWEDNILTNADFSGDDWSCFRAKDYFSDAEGENGVINDPVIEDGAIKVTNNQVKTPKIDPETGEQAKDGYGNPLWNEDAWNTQFWIRSPEVLPIGSKFLVKFDYKADNAGKASTQAHSGTPGGYIHWDCGVGNVDFAADEWKSFEKEITVSADMGGKDDAFQSIAFNLNEDVDANVYYFKNISIQLPHMVAAVDFAVSSIGWGSYCCFDEDVDLGEAKGYAAVFNGKSVDLIPVTEVPAGEAVLIEGAGKYTFEVISRAAAIAENDLEADKDERRSDGTYYALADGSQGIGFYKVAENQMVPAGKGFLVLESNFAPEFIPFNNGTTSISEKTVVKNNAEGVYYNLAGQRVAQPTKGLYIVNGKKVIK